LCTKREWKMDNNNNLLFGAGCRSRTRDLLITNLVATHIAG
jgi:hypothetical protein